MRQKWFKSLAIGLGMCFMLGTGVGCKDSEKKEALETIDTSTCNVFVDDDALDGGNGTETAPFQTLVQARDYVRTIKETETRDIRVYIRDGYYFQPKTFVLTEEDSASSGRKIYWMNYPNEKPVISGGKKVTDWRFVNGLYEAEVEPNLPIRNLFINGERKIRARSEDVNGLAKTVFGYTISADSEYKDMKFWGNLQDIELVGTNSWKMFRVGVEKISDDLITPNADQWAYSQVTGNFALKELSWIENAKELLDEENEWYYDRFTGKIYYKPQEDEKLRSCEVIVPVTTGLMRIEGELDNKVSGLVFQGLTFAYDAWDEVETLGYVEHQSGVIQNGTGWFDMYKTPGSVHVSCAENLVFEKNEFHGLGINGLALTEGSRNIQVISNQFYDISATAISIADIRGTDPREPDVEGEIYDHHPSDERRIVENITVENNVITKVGAEYYSNPGIMVGYARNISILNNTLFDLPYSGISLGWGWGYPDDANQTVCRNNIVKGNLLYDFMKTMHDGGGIYTLGEQPDSQITENYIACQKGDYSYIYLDNGSAGWSVTKNVITQTYNEEFGDCSYWVLVSQHIPEPEALLAHDNVLSGNWYSYGLSIFQPGSWKPECNNLKENNTEVENQQWPDEAKSIIDKAGSTLVKGK